MKRINEKCCQSGIGFIHKKVIGILWEDINAFCPRRDCGIRPSKLLRIGFRLRCDAAALFQETNARVRHSLVQVDSMPFSDRSKFPSNQHDRRRKESTFSEMIAVLVFFSAFQNLHTSRIPKMPRYHTGLPHHEQRILLSPPLNRNYSTPNVLYTASSAL